MAKNPSLSVPLATHYILGRYVKRFGRERAERQTDGQTGPILYPRPLMRKGKSPDYRGKKSNFMLQSVCVSESLSSPG